MDPFDQLTDPVFDGGVLDTDILDAEDGTTVESTADILEIVGAATVVNDPVAFRPYVPSPFFGEIVYVYVLGASSPVTDIGLEGDVTVLGYPDIDIPKYFMSISYSVMYDCVYGIDANVEPAVIVPTVITGYP